MKNKTLLGLFLLGTLALSRASAGVIAYSAVLSPGQYATDTDALNAWTGAGPVAGTITFTGVSFTNFTSYTSGPVTFSSSNGNTLNTSNNGFGPGSGTYLVNASPTNIAGDGTVFGLAFNFRCYSCDPQTATITVTTASGSTSFSVLTSNTGITNFFGARSDLAIQNLQVSFGGATPFVALDNVAYGGQATPEAATMILIGTGLALIARFRKYASHAGTSV